MRVLVLPGLLLVGAAVVLLVADLGTSKGRGRRMAPRAIAEDPDCSAGGTVPIS